MIHRFNDFEWTGTERSEYKDRPGSWLHVSRCNLSPTQDARFEVRYFEVAQGGYTSFEMHEHEHCVVVIRGKGEVKLEQEWSSVGLFDVVRIAGNTPHQFRNCDEEPLGILCVVDKERDRPVLLDPDGLPRASE
jgi:quercetin dioxygenase-like cupin family protein